MNRADPFSARKIVADHLRAAGLDTVRFIDVDNGRKRSTNHTQRAPDSDRLSGNYGVFAGRGEGDDGDGWLVDVDIDDYASDESASDALDAVLDLPATLTVETPHTDGETGGHRFYAVTGDVVDAMRDVTDGASNPSLSWGEVRVANQYVVGPGSQLDGCDKDECDECEQPDGGMYRIVDNRPIATITADELADVLRADPAYADSDGGGDVDVSAYEADGDTDAEAVARSNDWFRDYLASGDDDRSQADFRACCIMIEHGVAENDARALLDDSPNTKVHERGSDYWRSTWRKAVRAAETDETGENGERSGVSPAQSGGSDAENHPADGCETDETADDSTDGMPTPDKPLVRRNGGYAVYHPPRDDDGDGWYEQLTNFQIEATTFLRATDGSTKASLTVYPAAEGDEYDVTVPLTVFNDPRAFKREVVTGRTTTFDGDTADLNRLRRFVGGQAAPERIGVERIGLFGDGYDELVTPIGTLDTDGWVDEPEHAYVPQGIGVESKWSPTPAAGDEFDADDVADVLETLPQTRKSDRLLPVLGWFYASGLRPLIHKWTGEFNILNVTGGTGAGKSSTLETLWRLFGMDDDPLSVAEETKFAVTRSLAATNSVPVWFDEYKPATTDSWRVDALHGLLRSVTRGGTVQRGNADKTTDEYRLSAPTVVSGEQRIQGSAEQRRCVMTTFSPTATDDGTDTARAYKELTGEGYLENGEFVDTDAADPQAHALAYYRFIAGLDADDARERWDTAAVDVADMLADVDEANSLGSAAQQGLQTVVFGLRLYREFAETVDADVADLVDETAVESAVRYSAHEFVGGGHKSHVDVLMTVAAGAARNDYLETGEHYTVVKDGTPNAEIRLNMSAAFDQLTRYVRDFDVSAEVLDTYGDYRDRLKELAEKNGGYVVAYRQNSPPVGRAIGIHARRAADALDGFDPRAFGCDAIRPRDDSDNDGSGGEIPQGERLSVVMDAIDDICQRDDGTEHARHAEIVNAAMDAGVSQSAAHDALDKLSREGQIRQPLTGQYRRQ